MMDGTSRVESLNELTGSVHVLTMWPPTNNLPLCNEQPGYAAIIYFLLK